MSIAVSPAQSAVLVLLFLAVFLLSAAQSEDPNSVFVGKNLCPVSQYGGQFCPVNCFRPDPVCGQNGVTYWCGCPDAACAGVRVVKIGACEVGNGGSGLVSGQAFLLIHIIWLFILGFSLLCGLL
ncbi:hypothetical protein KSP40_PGU008102 [Platanthera guangdongensis]|uniref:Serine protease inhibitor, Kazal-type family protein n=1 Tax=Platanthera guangdongensis TaxID=2320717 RepID=A0ABR2LPD9_9ASPA